MARGVRYEPQTRELAFRVWRQNGQNWTEALRVMQSAHGFKKLTRQRLYDWAEQDGWQDRAARLQHEAEKAELAEMLGRERFLADLERRKKQYEDYFDGLKPGQMDNAAVTAYAGLLKTMEQMQTKIEAGAGRSNLQLAADVVKHFSKFLREKHPEHAAAFLGMLDEFQDRLVEIYG